jgi:hypothetical protein
MRTNLRDIAAAAASNPADPLWEAAGDLSDYEIFHNLVLVATYIRPEKIGSIIVTDNRLIEDRFQGKVGLVLKCGPLAFKDDASAKFGDVELRPGDASAKFGDVETELFLRDRRTINDGLSCRLIEDTFVRGRVTDPSLIY